MSDYRYIHGMDSLGDLAGYGREQVEGDSWTWEAGVTVTIGIFTRWMDSLGDVVGYGRAHVERHSCPWEV